jgi:hypothetical protein
VRGRNVWFPPRNDSLCWRNGSFSPRDDRVRPGNEALPRQHKPYTAAVLADGQPVGTPRCGVCARLQRLSRHKAQKPQKQLAQSASAGGRYLKWFSLSPFALFARFCGQSKKASGRLKPCYIPVSAGGVGPGFGSKALERPPDGVAGGAENMFKKSKKIVDAGLTVCEIKTAHGK